MPSRMMIRVGRRIQKLGTKVSASRHTDAQARLPVGENVEEDEILGSVVADVAETAEIFPGEIEDGLGERHEVCRKTEKRGDRGIEDIGEIQIEGVDNEFYEVESG